MVENEEGGTLLPEGMVPAPGSWWVLAAVPAGPGRQHQSPQHFRGLWRPWGEEGGQYVVYKVRVQHPGGRRNMAQREEAEHDSAVLSSVNVEGGG